MLIDSKTNPSPLPSSASSSDNNQSPDEEPASPSDEESMGGRSNHEVDDDVSSVGNEEVRDHVISLLHDESVVGSDLEEETSLHGESSDDSTLSRNAEKDESLTLMDDEESREVQQNKGIEHQN